MHLDVQVNEVYKNKSYSYINKVAITSFRMNMAYFKNYSPTAKFCIAKRSIYNLRMADLN